MEMLVGEIQIRVCRALYIVYLTHAITKNLCGPQLKHAALTDAKDPPKQAKHLKRVIGNAQTFHYLRSKLSIKPSNPATIIQTLSITIFLHNHPLFPCTLNLLK